MRYALRREEFEIYYQPVVCLQGNQVVGAEALIRWNHPKEGLILPNSFIPVAEESGLIYELSDWIIATVCHQIRDWTKKGMSSPQISINISPLHFYRHDFLDNFRQIIKNSGVDPHSLVIEVTEGLAMKHIETATAKLGTLKEMGVQIALDDFGIGHSSLNYLKALPVNKIKIDKSFVQNSITDPIDAAIISAISTLSRSMGITIVAEGVETQEQEDFLRKSGFADEIQGFLISQAIPAPAFSRFIQNWEARE